MPEVITRSGTPSRSRVQRLVAPLSALVAALAIIGTLWATTGQMNGAAPDAPPATPNASQTPAQPTAGSRDPIPVQTDLPELGESQVEGEVPRVEPTEPPATDIGTP